MGNRSRARDAHSYMSSIQSWYTHLCKTRTSQAAPCRVGLWPEPIHNDDDDVSHRRPRQLRLRHSACLEILARAYHNCSRVVQSRQSWFSLTRRDWRDPKSHASLAVVAAVLGILHAVAGSCFKQAVWCWPKSRPRP